MVRAQPRAFHGVGYFQGVHIVDHGIGNMG
jgi:hypothetical protein